VAYPYARTSAILNTSETRSLVLTLAMFSLEQFLSNYLSPDIFGVWDLSLWKMKFGFIPLAVAILGAPVQAPCPDFSVYSQASSHP
jgi:hypothetical protein